MGKIHFDLLLNTLNTFKILILCVHLRNPTPSNMEDNLIMTTWSPINPNNVMHDLRYMDITDTLEMKSNPELERQQFWDYMYEHYNGNAI